MWFSEVDGWERQKYGSKRKISQFSYLLYEIIPEILQFIMAIGCQIIRRIHLKYSPKRDISIMGWVRKQLYGEKFTMYVHTQAHIQARAHICAYILFVSYSLKKLK